MPGRFPLRSMRAVDTSTASSLAVLTAGIGPRIGGGDAQLAADLRLRPRGGYSTAFWTSQNLDFGKSRLWVDRLGVNKSVSATDLDPHADIDVGVDERRLPSGFAPSG